MTDRDEWLRRVKNAADDHILDSIRVDGRPLELLEVMALRVLAGRLSWPSLHWGIERVHPDAWPSVAKAFVDAGWRPAPFRLAEIADAIREARKLWETEARTAKTIPARASDPATSHAATRAIKLKAGTQRARLLAAFATKGATFGLTDEEAADLADGVPYRSEFAKRCSELRDAGWIEPCVYVGTSSPVTRKGVAGHHRIVSQITDAGRAALERLSDD